MKLIPVYCNASINGSEVKGELFNLTYGENGNDDDNVDNEDDEDIILRALQYSLSNASGEHKRPTRRIEEDTGGYAGLLGGLEGNRLNARFSPDTYRQKYRTLFYALHWEAVYIYQFGNDEYMAEARAHIRTLISNEEIDILDNYFKTAEVGYGVDFTISDIWNGTLVDEIIDDIFGDRPD